MEILHNILAFAIVTSVIIFIHEFGHYFVARLCGIKVEVFSIGFGPQLFSYKDRKNTNWKICIFPFGGYVKMFGDTNVASSEEGSIIQLTEEEKKYAFVSKPLLVKSAVVAAGPFANFILAVIILSGLFFYYGKPYAIPEVNFVESGSRAEQAGIKVGDIIKSVNQKTINSFDQLEQIISLNPENELSIKLDRAGEELTLKAKPAIITLKDDISGEIKIGRLGIGSQTFTWKKLSILEALNAAAQETWSISRVTLESISQIIVGQRSTEELGGPIRIAQYSGESLRKGMSMLLFFMAMLSINLGLINLFPIPLLDGGHLVFYGIEALCGKRVATSLQRYGVKIGFAIIIFLIIFSTLNDLKNVKFFSLFWG